MPTSRELKSGDFSFLTPRHRATPPSPPQEKSDDSSSPSNRIPVFTLTSQRKKKKISGVFLRWTKVEPRSSGDFPMLAQRIRKCTQVFWRQIDFWFFWGKKNLLLLGIVQSRTSYYSCCRKFAGNWAFHVLGFLLVNGDPIRQSVIWPWKLRKRLVNSLHH